jgi:Uma2 family endonuclease
MFSTEEPAELPVRIQDDDGRWTWSWDPPEIELIDGERVPKVSPKRRHGRVQGELFVVLNAWGKREGYEVATEWRFHLSSTNSYVPDIAAASIARLDPLDDVTVEEPRFAPDVAVEVRSPSNRARHTNVKIARYLEHGGRLVLDVDPATRTIVAHDSGGSVTFRVGDILEHPAAPGLQIDLRSLFDAGDRRRS